MRSLHKVICVEFFDDFSQIEPAATSNSFMALEGLLELLGWTVSTGDKRKPFEKAFVSLGVVVDLSGTINVNVVLSHKPGRIDAIQAQRVKLNQQLDDISKLLKDLNQAEVDCIDALKSNGQG